MSVGGTELDTWVYCHLWMNLGSCLHRCSLSRSTDLGLNFAETILSSESTACFRFSFWWINVYFEMTVRLWL